MLNASPTCQRYWLPMCMHSKLAGVHSKHGTIPSTSLSARDTNPKKESPMSSPHAAFASMAFVAGAENAGRTFSGAEAAQLARPLDRRWSRQRHAAPW